MAVLFSVGDAGAESSAASETNGRLTSHVAPTGYKLSITVDPRKEVFSGETRIGVRLAVPAKTIALHARAMTIASAAASLGKERVAAKASVALAPGELEEPSLLTLEFDRELPAGDVELAIAYSGPFNPKLAGLYRVKDGDEWYAFTQFEPNDARRAFPCFDEPGWKVPFDLALTVPKGLVAISNTPEVSRESTETATTFRFARSRPLPTYLVAFGVGALDVREGAKEPVAIRLVTAKGKTGLGDIALDAADAVLKRLAAYFGSPYPYEKLDIVAVPEFAAGAMENAGFVTFREELVLLDPKQAGEQARRALAGVMAHELAHQWFGNFVTMKWWNDLWLNEAFATWITNKIVDGWHPEYRFTMERVVEKAEAMKKDALAAARKIRQPVRTGAEAEEAFDAITYEKGAAVLAMLEAWVGEEKFRDGVRGYLAKNAWGNATAEDLLGAVAAAAAKDVAGVASTFLDQTGVPLVSIEPVCKDGKVTLKFAQQRYVALGAGKTAGDQGASRWKVPACVRLEFDDGPAERFCTIVGEGAQDAAVSFERCPKAVVPNVDEAGYYRTALPREWMEKLPSAKLSAAERLGVVINATSLLQMGALPADAFFEQLVAFGSDADRFVVDAVIDGLRLAEVALVDDESRAGFRALVKRALEKNAARVGLTPRDGDDAETRLLRRALMSALGGLAEDAAVIEVAERLVVAYLKDRASVDPDLAQTAAALASMKAGKKRFDEWVALAGAATNPQERLVAMNGLGGFASGELARTSLDLALTEKVRKQDAMRIPRMMFANHATREVAYTWLRESFDQLKKMMPEGHLGYMYLAFGQFATAERRSDAARFFGAPERQIEGGARRLAEGLELLDLSIALAARERARASAYLRKQAN